MAQPRRGSHALLEALANEGIDTISLVAWRR